MSQFRVQKVTKVKGPSELPAGKTNESKKVRANPSNTAERPQAQPRLKKTSYSKSAELKSSTSSSDKPSTSTSSGQRSSTRNRPTAAKRSTPKTCPSQQSKRNGSPQTASKQTRNKPGVDSTKTHSVLPKPSVPQRPPHKETPVKKSTQIEKENSYDASGSDSDEPHLSGKLSPKDDIGYETGSFDEIDGSNSESTSPAAGEENKTILSQSREEESTASYSYAEVEFRPLIVSDEGGVSAPVHTRHQDQLQSPENVDNTNDRLSYAYVSDEFRPLVITDNGGIAAPQETKKSEQINNLPVVDQRRAPMRYEEVEVLSGKFDRANVNTSQLRAGIPGSSNIAVENEDDTYEAVDQQNITSQLQHRTEQITNTRQQDFTLNNVDQDVGDVYAVVQKDKTKKESKENPKLAALSYKVQESETPPELPSRMDITKSDLCESISGELQDMISAYDEVNTNGKCSRSSSREGYVSSDNSKVAARPPLPKPYSGSGMTVENTGLESTSSDEDFNGSPLYAAVQKKPKNKTQKKKDPQITKQPEEIPPPLPSRTVLEKDDTLGREVDLSQLEKESQEKSKKSGFGIFKKKHQRKMSDGNVISNAEKLGYLSPGASKKGHKRSKSQDDIAKVMNNLLGDSVGKTRGDSGDVIEPYLAVDITDPPNTPRELQGLKSYWEDKEDQYLDNDLPEGWKEVESENGTKYYWHVSSGTTQWERPQVLQRPKKTSGEQIQPSQVVERQKVLSFPVHSMGWIELEENQVAPHNMSDTIGDCISTLARNRKDLWQTSETWGEGKDIRLLLEGDTLKLVEPRNKITLLVQPVSKMRVWGVGKEDHRDFAYVARDPNTGKHKCHMFRCHGNISGRAITTALHEMCNKILEEKKRAQEISKKISQTKPWSDIINTPAPLSAKDSAGFNEKPFREQKKDFTATYLGCTDVPKPTGMEMLNKAINKVASRGGAKRTVLIHVTVSCIRITDCTSQEEISEDRVRFLSFMGVGKDERLCGYVMVNEPDQFVCHVFQCTPNAAPLTKALEEACQLRYQKCLDAHPEMASKVIASQEQESDKSKDKANFMSSVQGLLGKLGTKKSGIKKEDVVTGPPLPKPSHTFMVKYYGALPVAVGTGIETVEEAAKHLTGGTLLICQLDVAINGVTLYDSQRSALSRRHMDADTISFCGLTSDNGHFGLIQCQGGGKYVCHVFSEYKTKAAPIVAAIHETL